MNKACGIYTDRFTWGCSFPGGHLRCEKYTDKEKLSAWELFRELLKTYGNKFIDKVVRYEALERLKDKKNKFVDGFWVERFLSREEPEAIEILLQIQKELEE
jgi:hypothetical protein